jgi:hypothetical protein
MTAVGFPMRVRFWADISLAQSGVNLAYLNKVHLPLRNIVKKKLNLLA